MRLQLNKRLVENVTIFAGCPREFFEALVQRLQPCICVAGDFVFYESEIGSRMYFIKRGIAQVLGEAGCTIVATVREGDYFGEVSLLTDQPRTASVIAVTDLMLLSLSATDLEAVLSAYPQAAVRIEAAAKERLKTFKSGAVARRGSHSGGGLIGSFFGSLAASRNNSITRAANGLASGRRVSLRLLSLRASGNSKVTPSSEAAKEERRPSLEDGFKAEAAGELVRSQTDGGTSKPRPAPEPPKGQCRSCYSMLPMLRGQRLRCQAAAPARTEHRRTSLSQAHVVEDRSREEEERAVAMTAVRGRRASQFATVTAPNPLPVTGVRRRSVDSGLTICFNEQRRPPNLLAARAAHATVSSSRRGSSARPLEPLRKSLDCGWDSADDHRRRHSLNSRFTHGQEPPLSDQLVPEAMQALELREQRRISRSSNVSTTIDEYAPLHDFDHSSGNGQLCAPPTLLHEHGVEHQLQHEPGYDDSPLNEVVGKQGVHTIVGNDDDEPHPRPQHDDTTSEPARALDRERNLDELDTEPNRRPPSPKSRRASCAHLRRGSCVVPLVGTQDASFEEVPSSDPAWSALACSESPHHPMHGKRCSCSYDADHLMTQDAVEERERSPSRDKRDDSVDMDMQGNIREAASTARRTSLSIARGVRQPVAKAAAKFFRTERRRVSRTSCTGASSSAPVGTVAGTATTSSAPEAHVQALKDQLNETLSPVIKEWQQLKTQQDDLWKEMKVVSDKINQLYSGKWM